MDKEMKKLLLVAVSVGVFLLITITVGIIILTPKAQSQETAFSTSVPYTHGRIQPAPDIMTNIPPAPAIISDHHDVNTNIVNETHESAETDIINGDHLTIQVPRPTAAAIPDMSGTAARQQVTIAPAPHTERETVKPAPAQTTETASAAAPAQRASNQTQARQTSSSRSAAQSRAISDFWVQTGAFSSMVRAEDAKEVLSTKGLTSIIENRIINGENFYRVRLGPYTSENEAKHWLDIVKLINGFENSQVRQTTR